MRGEGSGVREGGSVVYQSHLILFTCHSVCVCVCVCVLCCVVLGG